MTSRLSVSWSSAPLVLLALLAPACGDDASDPRADAGIDAAVADYEVVADLDLHTPLDALDLLEARAVCLEEFAKIDLCTQVVFSSFDSESCEELMAECRALDPVDARAACEDADYSVLQCGATAGEYLNCIAAWEEGLSCEDVAYQGAWPAACDPLFTKCPDLANNFGYFGDPGPPQRIGWAPDLSIPLDQDVDDPLALAPPEQGFQLLSGGMMIPEGQDVEYFEILEVPGDPSDVHYVDRIELEMTPYSHHMSVYAVRVDSIAHEDLIPGSRGPGQASEVLSLNDSGTMGYDSLVERLTGSQAPYHDETYPTGVGRVLHGGQKILLDYHYLNLTDEPIPAAHRINFHTTSEPTGVIRQFQWTDIGIDIPAGGTATVEGECTFQNDVIVVGLTRHTHSRSTTFDVYYVGGDADGEHVFQSVDWELDTDFRFPDPGRTLRAGEGFRFVCAYENPDDFSVGFGERATDEMCILFGLFYKADGTPAAPEDCLMF